MKELSDGEYHASVKREAIGLYRDKHLGPLCSSPKCTLSLGDIQLIDHAIESLPTEGSYTWVTRLFAFYVRNWCYRSASSLLVGGMMGGNLDE